MTIMVESLGPANSDDGTFYVSFQCIYDSSPKLTRSLKIEDESEKLKIR